MTATYDPVGLIYDDFGVSYPLMFAYLRSRVILENLVSWGQIAQIVVSNFRNFFQRANMGGSID